MHLARPQASLEGSWSCFLQEGCAQGCDEEHLPLKLCKLGAVFVCCGCRRALFAGAKRFRRGRCGAHPSFFSLPVVLQGSLHLEDIGAALQPGRQLELLVQVQLVLQDLWGRCALAQPELRQPAVRSAPASLLSARVKLEVAESQGFLTLPLVRLAGRDGDICSCLGCAMRSGAELHRV